MARYNQYIHWHTADGGEQSVKFGTDADLQDAINGALALAKEHGWTPPRWWQWWRWGDYDYSKLSRE